MPTLLIVYNTKTGNTELMAKAVEQGAKTVQGVDVVLSYHVNPSQLEAADAVIMGVPTYNHRPSLDIHNLLEKAVANNITLKGRTAAAFGSYGWSGEAPKYVLEILRKKLQMNVSEPPIMSKYKPDEEILRKCRNMGKRIAQTLL